MAPERRQTVPIRFVRVLLVTLTLAAVFVSAPSSHTDRAAALPPPMASIELSQSTGLVDGQQITVTGTGYPATTLVAVIECSTTATTELECSMPSIRYVTTQGDGSFSITFTMSSTIYTAEGRIDCSVPGACRIGAGVVPDGAVSAVAPFDIAPGPVPTVTMTPSTGLRDGQTVVVTGTGFPAGAWLAMIECRNGATGQPGCDMSTISYLYADGTGQFAATFMLRSRITTQEGAFDCTVPGACRFGTGVVPTGASASIDLEISTSDTLAPGYTG